jgi:general secretion pathway protein G
MTSSKTLKRRRKQRGVTLIELMVVLVIIGLIAAFAVPQVLKVLDDSRQKSAAIQIKALAGALDIYKLDTGQYPPDDSLDALVKEPVGADRWNGPYITSADSLIDPWGRPYQYRFPGDHGAYDLYSLGADGAVGGDGEDADITNW